MPSRLGALLDMKTSDIEKIVYFQDYVVTDPGKTPLKKKQLLTEDDIAPPMRNTAMKFEAEMGAEAIKKLLGLLDLNVETARSATRHREDQQQAEDQGPHQASEDDRGHPQFREQVRVDGHGRDPGDSAGPATAGAAGIGNFATSDLNDLYRRIINRNNRLKKLVDLNAPEVIIRNEKRMLQQAVDARSTTAAAVARCWDRNRPLKSLDRHDQGQAGPVPREPAGQARGLFRARA